MFCLPQGVRQDAPDCFSLGSGSLSIPTACFRTSTTDTAWTAKDDDHDVANHITDGSDALAWEAAHADAAGLIIETHGLLCIPVDSCSRLPLLLLLPLLWFL